MSNYIVTKTFCCDVEAETEAEAATKAEALFAADPEGFSTVDIQDADQ